MCGIAGFADVTPAPARTLEGDRQRVKAMCDVMRHRGPDDEGFFVEPNEWWHFNCHNWATYPILDIPFSAIR